MGQESLNQLLHQGIAAARAGQRETARTILQNVVRLDPRNEIGWMWLSSVAADDSERLFCLRKLIEINPANEFALKGLRALGVEPARPTSEYTGGTVVPTLDEARHARIIQAVDEFLQRYQGQPVADAGAVVWSHKRRGRYAESGAKRLRQAMAAAAVLLVALVMAGGFLIIRATGVFEARGEQLAQAITRVPTLTPRPTLTPTQGGPTPTDFPVPMAVPPTEIPKGLVAGDPFGLAEPTEIYPAPHPNVTRMVQEAAGYYTIGDYETARDLLRAERERSGQHCYPVLVYYEALSLAGLKNYQEAIDLLEWAQTYKPERGYSTCEDKPIILAGLAEVLYEQHPRSQRALELATQALQKDENLVQAAVTKARLELALGEVTAARGTVAQALVKHPHDLNLLVVAAEVELADNQPIAALNHLGHALYLDPALLPALHLQAQTYLRLADESAGVRRMQYYGLAVRSAQTLLLYYPGEPAGYLYLAQARLGEGNQQMAETALSRILENADSLPPETDALIWQAYKLRGTLRFTQGRYEEARGDLLQAAFQPDGALDVQVGELLVKIGLNTGDYTDAQTWVSQLVAANPQNSIYQLWQAQLLVEVCALYGELSCDYSAMLQKLSDSFIGALPDKLQQAEALSLRAQAQYHLTMQQQGQGTTSAGQGRLSLQLALNDLTQAMLLRDDPVDQYYRGLILESLKDPVRAVESYRWLLFWSQWYRYPFADQEFEARVAKVEAQAKVWLEEQGRPTATPTLLTSTPTPTVETEPGATPMPTRQLPAGGGERTATPVSAPAAAFPDKIP
ncbi:MAG: tetratricopeptide repeat protein [Aggregatilineaceae bacterium]